MDDRDTAEQAREIAALLPALMRRLFSSEDDPVAELPLAQLRVCSVLYEGQRTMSALSRELRVSLSAMTQLADRMERADLVQRTAEGADRRVRCLQLTPRGVEIMRAREDNRVDGVLSALARLAPEARDEVLGAIKTLMSAVDDGANADGVAQPDPVLTRGRRAVGRVS